MQPVEKKRFLIVNALCWLAAVVVPVVINALPVSQPPRILPLFTYGWSSHLRVSQRGS